MTYKSFYEDLESRAPEELHAISPDLRVRWAWNTRIRRTISIMETILQRFRKVPVLVDVGCAGAWLHQSLIRKCHHHYVGVDISFSYLSSIDDTAQSCRVLCDASAMPFKQFGSDIVTSFETVEHLPDPRVAAAELKRITSSVLAISVPLEGIDISFLGARKYDRHAAAKEIKMREFIDKVGWDKGLRMIEKNTGSAHINFFTAGRLRELFRDKSFRMTRIRGAFFYIPQLSRILSNKVTRALYLFTESVFFSRIPIFHSLIRYLRYTRIGNRYGIIILNRQRLQV